MSRSTHPKNVGADSNKTLTKHVTYLGYHRCPTRCMTRTRNGICTPSSSRFSFGVREREREKGRERERQEDLRLWEMREFIWNDTS